MKESNGYTLHGQEKNPTKQVSKHPQLDCYFNLCNKYLKAFKFARKYQLLVATFLIGEEQE